MLNLIFDYINDDKFIKIVIFTLQGHLRVWCKMASIFLSILIIDILNIFSYVTPPFRPIYTTVKGIIIHRCGGGGDFVEMQLQMTENFVSVASRCVRLLVFYQSKHIFVFPKHSLYDIFGWVGDSGMLDEVIYKIIFICHLLLFVQLAWKVTGCRIFFHLPRYSWEESNEH